ncbi:MAG: hypothetical protein JKX78_09900 [Alteromonadaceae bacterium]|nr:hypothetical protein [Alteromonadaceae bacterium]
MFNITLSRVLVYILVSSVFGSAFAATESLPISTETNSTEINQNIDKINHLFTQKEQELPYQQLVRLPTKMIKNRQLYSPTILAKAYALLADAALYRGDSEQAFQFAEDGLGQGEIEQEVRLILLMKVADSYYEKSKYNRLLKIIIQAVNLAQKPKYRRYLLNAYAYQASAYALLGQYNQAYSNLKLIDDMLTKYPKYSNQIELLQILAIAHYNLGHYQTSLTLHLKLLKLQFDLQQKRNLARTYYNVALTYLKLKQYDDAYNAFWQMKMLADKKEAPILLAYAELGLGETLFKQGEFEVAYTSLIKAEKLFKGRNLTRPYLSNLLVLAQVAIETQRNIFANKILRMAEKIAVNVELTREQVELYKMLSLSYQQEDNYQKALQMLNKYWRMRIKFKQVDNQHINLPNKTKELTNKSKALALKFSNKGQLYTQYHNKNKQLRMIIWIFIFIILALIIVVFALWFKHRSYLLHADYRELEQPLDYMPAPLRTKKNYQQCYKRARKFNYSLTVGYLHVVNWSELSFQFSDKIMTEVANTIAHIINDNLTEFDQVGLLAEGEYILLFPHRTQREVNTKVKHIADEIGARFFANLGDFSVIISAASQTADIQDIDPFVFLAQLTDSLKN